MYWRGCWEAFGVRDDQPSKCWSPRLAHQERAPDQRFRVWTNCEGCTWVTTQIGDLSYVHSRDVTYATFCQGPYEQSVRHRDFTGWDLPWYSVHDSLDTLLAGRQIGYMHLVCYLRDREQVFETYWTNGRGVETMDYNFALWT